MTALSVFRALDVGDDVTGDILGSRLAAATVAVVVVASSSHRHSRWLA